MKTLLALNQIQSDKNRTFRLCGPCTACCRTFPVLALDKQENESCGNLCPSGCSIYTEKPDACSEFECLWLNGLLNGDERRRPDNLGLIFFLTKTIMGLTIACWELRPNVLSDQSEPGYQALRSIIQDKLVLVFRYAPEGTPSMRSFVGPPVLVNEIAKLAEKSSYQVENKTGGL